MGNKSLQKLGFIIYHILTLKSERLDSYTYAKYCDTIYDTLLEIAPCGRERILNPDIKEFVEQTNRRLNNGKILL